jgi:hypothetical protein
VHGQGTASYHKAEELGALWVMQQDDDVQQLLDDSLVRLPAAMGVRQLSTLAAMRLTYACRQHVYATAVDKSAYLRNALGHLDLPQGDVDFDRHSDITGLSDTFRGKPTRCGTGSTSMTDIFILRSMAMTTSACTYTGMLRHLR